MLTAPLLRVRLPRGKVRPQLIRRDKEATRERAAQVLELFATALEEQWARQQLDEALGDLLGDGRDAKLVRGLAKVALDRSDFEVEAPIDPIELRAAVFERARAHAPLALEPGPLERPTATTVLEELAEELGHSAQALRDALYADLKEEQRLRGCELDLQDVDAFIDRYNLSLVQAVLLRAERLEVELDDPSGPRLRQLLRYIKFHRLIHELSREDGRVRLRLDGPSSVLKQSTRYGMQLATFLPALLLQECSWRARAELRWGSRRTRRVMELDQDTPLVSHYRDRGAYLTRESRYFRERFAAADTAWSLSDRTEPIDLAGRSVVLPDYALRHEGRVAYLEIVGFWRRDYLERRLELLARYGPGNLVLAVSKRLRVEGRTGDLPGVVVPFAEIVPVKKVLAAVEEVAIKEPG